MSEKKTAITGVEESKYDEVFTKFTFNDLKGNVITLTPWPLSDLEDNLAIVGKIYAKIKETLGDQSYGLVNDLNVFFQLHLDKFYLQFPGELCNLLIRTVKRDKAWLECMDIALGLMALDVIWRQNFTGPRVMDQVLRFADPVLQEEPNPEAGKTTDQSLPGNA